MSTNKDAISDQPVTTLTDKELAYFRTIIVGKRTDAITEIRNLTPPD